VREVPCERGVGVRTKDQVICGTVSASRFNGFDFSFFMPLITGKGGFFMQRSKKSTLVGDIKVFNDPKALCFAALLAACAVAIAYICKAFTFTPSLRLTFENLPLILSGYVFGPFVGLLTGLTSDFVSTAISQYGLGALNPILTVGSASVGLFAGIISHYVFPKKSKIQIILCVFVSHIIANMIIKTVGLWMLLNTTPVEIILRIFLYTGIGIFESFVMISLMKSKGFTKALGVKTL